MSVGAKLGDEEIEDRTSHHPPTAGAALRHSAVRKVVEDTMALFNDVLPLGREASLAFTKLEEAMFWANAAIARNHDKLEGS